LRLRLLVYGFDQATKQTVHLFFGSIDCHVQHASAAADDIEFVDAQLTRFTDRLAFGIDHCGSPVCSGGPSPQSVAEGVSRLRSSRLCGKSHRHHTAKGATRKILNGPFTKPLNGKGPARTPGTGRNRPLADSKQELRAMLQNYQSIVGMMQPAADAASKFKPPPY
jgi:hypothetical protein